MKIPLHQEKDLYSVNGQDLIWIILFLFNLSCNLTSWTEKFI